LALFSFLLLGGALVAFFLGQADETGFVVVERNDGYESLLLSSLWEGKLLLLLLWICGGRKEREGERKNDDWMRGQKREWWRILAVSL